MPLKTATPPPTDPYRDWLRQRLGHEIGMQKADQLIQSAVQRRGWAAMRPLGPRDVIAVLQDLYQQLVEAKSAEYADRWLVQTSNDLAELAEKIPVPVALAHSSQPSTPRPVQWGRRAHDLPLMLARVHTEIAIRSLSAIRKNKDLARLERAAEWDVQATQAEVRRWETEEMLTKLRATHSRIEVADQVAAARAQAEFLTLSQAQLEATPNEPHQKAQLAHNHLMLTQTQAFLDAFGPLITEEEADTPLSMLNIDLEHAKYSLGVPLHPNVLRARHGLNFALWQAGEAGEQNPVVQEAQQALTQAENDAHQQLEATLNAAKLHQQTLTKLAQQVDDLEQRALKLASLNDPIGSARVRLEWRQTRAAARIQANRLEEAVELLEALVNNTEGAIT